MAAGVLITALGAAATLGWTLLRSVDFGYALWYDVLAIEAHIGRFGPENRHRQGFARTDKAEHRRLFAAINRAVHGDTAILGRLAYRDPQGRRLGPLLHIGEIVHLKDVAKLIRGTLPWGWGMVGLWLVLSLAAWRLQVALPPWRWRWGGLLFTVAGLGLVVVWQGPLALFHRWHIWVFPPNHPWYFPYQESLMTTLMKAPDLFGAIAVAWGGLTIILWLILLVVADGLLGLANYGRGRPPRDPPPCL
ncbi:MAG: DUF1461 domain-containing protein [Candidatus Competibacterales bacterium]